MNATQRINRPLKDEDKWVGMTKKQILYLVIGILACVFEVRLFSALHISIVGIILAIITAVFFLMIAVVTLPYNKYMQGGGLRMDTLVLRLLFHQQRAKRCVYTRKNYAEIRKKKGGTQSALSRLLS